jgi:O-antigen ligase
VSLRLLGSRLASWGVIVAALFLPLSIAVPQWGLGMMAAGILLALISGERPRLPSGLLLPVAAFAAVGLLASVVSPVDVPWRGWTAWKPALFLLLVPASLALSDSPDRLIRRALVALLGAAFAVAVLGMVQHFTGFDLNWALGLRKIPVRIDAPVGRGFSAVGTFTSRLSFSAVESAALVLAAALALRLRSVPARIAAALVAIGCALGVGAAFARAAWIGTFAGGAILLFGLNRRAAAVLCAAAVAIAGAGMLLPTVRARAISGLQATANPDRLFIWSRAGEVLADHPVQGVGIYGFPIVAYPYYDRHDPLFPMHTWAHDMYFTLLAETGVAGLIAYVWIFVVVAMLALSALKTGEGPPWSAVRVGALGATVTLLTISLFHDLLYDGEPSMALFFFAGLAVSGLGRAREESQPR